MILTKYSTPSVNAPISLYSGTLNVIGTGGVALREPGTVSLKWEPYQRLEVAGGAPSLFDDRLSADLADIAASRLEITTTKTGTSGFVGIVNPSRIEVGDLASTVTSIILHLPNFYLEEKLSSARGVVQSVSLGDWALQIQTVRGAKQNILEQAGGYLITHVAELRRADGAPFLFEDAEPVIDSLFFSLSFIRGSRVSPLLLIGRDGSSERFEIWESPSIGSWKSGQNWAAGATTDWSDVPGKFLLIAQDPVWSRALMVSTFFYTEAVHQNTLGEARVLEMFTVLETLCWTYLNKAMGIMTDAEFKPNVPAVSRITRLLQYCSIPVAIPAEAAALNSFADGPAACSAIRNSIVHPDRTPQSPERVIQAGELLIWYFELAMLHALGYEGNYMNRNCWEVQSVPWK